MVMDNNANKPFFQRFLIYFVKIIIIFTVYFIAAKFGLGISPVSGFATLVWPPTGIALAVLFIFGLELWPAIFFGAFLVNLITGAPLPAALSIGAGNAMEAIIGAYLLRRFGFQKELERLKDVVTLIFFAAIFSTVISATVGVTTLLLANIVSFSSYIGTWTAWWIGDMLGNLIVAPFLFIWLSKSSKKVSTKGLAELIVFSALIIAISIFVFSSLSSSVNYPSLIYLVFPLLVWLAIRFNPKTIVSLILIISAIAIFGTVSGFGPFINATASQTLLQLQLFMGVLSTTMLVLASVVIERKKTQALMLAYGPGFKDLKKEKIVEEAKKNILMDWLRQLSVNKKLSIIIILIILILLFGITNFWVSMKVMSGIRSYVGGEGLWSKAQKEAINSLITYSISRDQADYNKFLSFLQVNMGDKQARLELNKKNPNLDIVRQGFVQGGNNPKDVNDLIFLYKWFKHVGYMDKAIKIWTKGDLHIEKLLVVGEKLHDVISTPEDQNNLQEQIQKADLIYSLINESREIDNQLTVLENDFSSTLGEGSRGIKNILLLITVFLSLVLGGFVLFIAILIGRLISQVDIAKTEFVSLASHQLRTPITAIKWYSTMISDKKTGPLKPQQEKYLLEIYHGNERMIKLINNLLSIARIEMGKLKINKQSVDVKKVLEDVIKEQQMEIGKRNQKIIINQPEALPKINTDSVLFSMILQNLISNAIKYTLENGEIICTVKKEGRKVVFQISDNGIGIAPEDQKRIFEKLFRGKNAMEQSKQRQNREGTGLGLYIVNKIAVMLGGKVWFKSALGHGTSFYLELPVSK